MKKPIAPNFERKERSPIPKASSDTQVMKAQIYVNRHIVAANKKASKQKGVLVDERAISINTYLGSVYAKRVEFTSGCVLVQDAAQARCSGATIWIEATFESLVLDGVAANLAMFQRGKDDS